MKTQRQNGKSNIYLEKEIMQHLEEWQQGYKENEISESFTDPKLLKSINTPIELLKVYTIAELKLERHLKIKFMEDLTELQSYGGIDCDTYLRIDNKKEKLSKELAAINKEISNNRGGF